LGCSGSGSSSAIIAGINWCTNQAKQGGKWIINMSLAGGKNSSTNTAVKNARQAGVIVAVAAGNNGKSACDYSPASAVEALTVGSTTSSDNRSSFSNFGSCLDLFAPGSGVISLGLTSNPSNPNAKSLSGTSMASPHVAGAAAIYYQLYNTADEAENALLAATASGKISDVKSGSPNKLVQVPLTIGGLPEPTKAPTPAPTKSPTPAPTKAPTPAPTKSPTPAPSKAPTPAPTKAPTAAPANAPTATPVKAPTSAPTNALTPAPTKAPTPVPTSLPTCNTGEVRFEFSLRTDDYSFEDNGYKLVKQGNSQPLFEKEIGFQTTPARNILYVETNCLGPGTYTLTVEDKFEDGLCCRFGFGYYEVKLDGVKQNSYSSVVSTDSTQQFGWGKTATHPFTIGSNSAPVPTSLPTLSPTSAPTIPPTPPPTSSPNCPPGSSGTLVEFVLKSDNYSQQDNHFKIVNSNNPGGTPLLARQDGAYNGPPGSVYTDRTCLPSGSYILTVFDDPFNDGSSDGLCCAWGEGYFQFYINGVLRTDVPQSWAGPPNDIPSSSFDFITYDFTV
jgi:hypothetical protein